MRDLLEQHLAETDSTLAARLLADWDTARSAFAQVLPARLRSASSTCRRRRRRRDSTPTATSSGSGSWR